MTKSAPSATPQPLDEQALFAAQQRHAPQMALTSASERVERIRRIHRWLRANESLLFGAMQDDFQKPAAEVLLGDLGALYYEINYTCRQLAGWMRPRRVPTPLPLLGTRGYISPEPKGNVLIISPWNYPFGLAIKPLVSAIAAGNVVLLKPSELTPHTSSLIRRMVDELFLPQEVAVVEGDAMVATRLLALPFNHIFFTGSPRVGKLVMSAAANQLASVTLELGGKSPVLVDETAAIQTAAEQIAWAKFFNNGQTCIAPDYLLVHASVKEPFMQAFDASVRRMYTSEGQPIQSSAHYCRMVSTEHFDRVKALIDDALSRGATLALGGETDRADRFIAPTALDGVTEGMAVMQEEIFGPVLPIVTYRTLDEALAIINERPKPLALYIQSRNDKVVDFVSKRTSAGNIVINDLMWQFGHMQLPFGGVNNSGIGKANGYFGFQELSNLRGVIRRDFGTARFIYPPYTKTVQRLIHFLVTKL